MNIQVMPINYTKLGIQKNKIIIHNSTIQISITVDTFTVFLPIF